MTRRGLGAPWMNRHHLAGLEDLDARRRAPDLDLLTDEPERDAILAAFKGNQAVEADI